MCGWWMSIFCCYLPWFSQAMPPVYVVSQHSHVPVPRGERIDLGHGNQSSLFHTIHAPPHENNPLVGATVGVVLSNFRISVLSSQRGGGGGSRAHLLGSPLPDHPGSLLTVQAKRKLRTCSPVLTGRSLSATCRGNHDGSLHIVRQPPSTSPAAKELPPLQESTHRLSLNPSLHCAQQLGLWVPCLKLGQHGTQNWWTFVRPCRSATWEYVSLPTQLCVGGLGCGLRVLSPPPSLFRVIMPRPFGQDTIGRGAQGREGSGEAQVDNSAGKAKSKGIRCSCRAEGASGDGPEHREQTSQTVGKVGREGAHEIRTSRSSC